MQGWIWLHRRLLQSAAFKSPRMLKVWIWSLLRANHRETKILWNGSEKDLLPGQFITGRFEGACECHMKPSTFYYQLSLLRRLGNLDIQSDNRNSLVTVVNWLQYQSTSEKSDSNFDNQLTTDGQPTDTDNNVIMKEGKKRERAPLSFPANAEEAKAFFTRQGFMNPDVEASKFFAYYAARNWEGVSDWRAQAQLWNTRTIEYAKRGNGQSPPEPGRARSKPLGDSSWKCQTISCSDCGKVLRADEVCSCLRENQRKLDLLKETFNLEEVQKK